jgi:hypothetical protein
MNYRTSVILATETLETTAATKVIDLNVQDPISALRFEAVWTSYSSAARLYPELDVFSKIELVDGSDVLFSLSGTELAAVHFYEGFPLIQCDTGNITSEAHSLNLQYDFGRFFRDPMLAFDPTKFRNPQLKLTYDPATPHASATSLTLEVTAELFDEKAISPIGFLRTTQLHSYSPGASTYEYIDLPTDLVIRKLYLQTREFGSAAATLLTDARLSEDNDKRVPFDITDTNWCNLCGQKWGLLFQNVWAYGNGASYPVFAAPCKYETIAMVNASAQNAIQCTTGTGGKFSFDTSTSTQIVTGILSGFLPYFVYCYPFGDDNDPADWYDVTRVGSLRLRVKSGSASSGATNNTILQQLRRY